MKDTQSNRMIKMCATAAIACCSYTSAAPSVGSLTALEDAFLRMASPVSTSSASPARLHDLLIALAQHRQHGMPHDGRSSHRVAPIPRPWGNNSAWGKPSNASSASGGFDADLNLLGEYFEDFLVELNDEVEYLSLSDSGAYGAGEDVDLPEGKMYHVQSLAGEMEVDAEALLARYMCSEPRDFMPFDDGEDEDELEFYEGDYLGTLSLEELEETVEDLGMIGALH